MDNYADDCLSYVGLDVEMPTWIGQSQTWEPMSAEMQNKTEAARRQHMEQIQKDIRRYLLGLPEDGK